MTVSKSLRGFFGIEEVSGPHSPKESDEDILNVIRAEMEKEDGEDELTTAEIAEKLSIKPKQTHNRLTELKGTRVKKRRAGQTDMWSLAPGEPEVVMNPQLGPVIARSSWARRKSKDVNAIGYFFAKIGFGLLIIAITILVSEVALPLLSWEVLLAFGYSSGIVGAFIVMSGEMLRIAGLITPKLVERLLLD